MNRQQGILSNQNYKNLNNYYDLLPGSVGTILDGNGKLKSPPIPPFVPSMAIQTVPNYSNTRYLGTPSVLQHGLSASQLNNGHFNISTAYSPNCTTFQKRNCSNNI